MRESCSCGAAIHVLSKNMAVEWRFTHRHGLDESHDLTSDTFPVGFSIPAEEEEE